MVGDDAFNLSTGGWDLQKIVSLSPCRVEKEDEKTIKIPPDLFDGLPEFRKTKRVQCSKLQILKDGKAKQKKIYADKLKKKIIREYNSSQKLKKHQMK